VCGLPGGVAGSLVSYSSIGRCGWSLGYEGETLSYIYPGIVIGALYALLGGSITLTYSLTGVINLAIGAIAYAVAYLFYVLVQVHHWGLLPAVVVCLLAAPVFGFLIWFAVFRMLEKKNLTVQLVATIGLSVAVPALMEFALPITSVFQSPGILPHGFSTIHWHFFNSSRDQLAAVVGAIICIGLLVVLVEKSQFGLSTRAVVDRPRFAESVGINTTRLSAISWILSCLLTGAAGLLLSPLIQLDAAQYTSLTVAALSVALVGRFRSLWITALAGVALGVVASLITGYAPVGSVIGNGLVPSLPFFLLVALLLIGRSLSSGRRDIGGDVERPRLAAVNVAAMARQSSFGFLYSLRYPLMLLVGAGAVAAAMYGFNPYWTGVFAAGIAFSVLFLGFTVSTGEGGVLCLGQAAFGAAGAFTAGRLATEAHLALPLAIVIGVLAATACGVVIGLMGTRLDQVGFALVTLAFALFCEQFAFNIQSIVPIAGVNYPTVKFGGLTSTQSQILLGSVLFAVVAGLLSYLKRGRFGRVCAAIRGNPVEGESIGINVKGIRVAVFALGSGVAGLGGVLVGIEQGNVGPVDFALLAGLVWVAVVVTVGVRGYSGALLAGLMFSIAPAAFQYVHIKGFGNLPTVMFGLGAVGLAKEPRGFLAQVDAGLRGLVTRGGTKPAGADRPGTPPDTALVGAERTGA
jgi:branched-chain amino acid transport system permease protein